MRIVITTRGRPDSLRMVLGAIESGFPNKCIDLLIIDDSNLDFHIDKNLSVVNLFDFNRLYVFSRRNNEELQAYAANIGREVKEIVVNCCELGRDDWNTPSARNAGLMIALAGGSTKSVLWLDDDVLFQGFSNIFKDANAELSVFPLRGCPDYGMATWLGWFFLVASPEFRSYCVKSGAWMEKISSSSLNLHAQLLCKYTNIFVSEDVMLTDHVFSLPINSGHGAAFVTKLSIYNAPLFAPFYSEDLCWMRFLLNRGASFKTLNKSVIHNSATKDILNVENFLKEETGSAASQAIRICSEDRSLHFGRVYNVLLRQRIKNISFWLHAFKKVKVEDLHAASSERAIKVVEMVVDGLHDEKLRSMVESKALNFIFYDAIWMSERTKFTRSFYG
jgi:hypothetical protein